MYPAEIPTWHAEKGELGKVQLYMGDGKGKTTAALGLALRASGHGYRVMVVQFMKGDIDYGELKAVSGLKNITIRQFGRPEFVRKGDPDPRDIELAGEALRFVRKVLEDGACDVLVLDEVNVAADFGLVDEREVIDIINMRPPKVEVVMTGRDPPRAFIELADLVTEMRKVKHPFDEGLGCREGVEY